MATMAMSKSSRIDLRLTDEQKQLIETAAGINSTSVSQWSVDRLCNCARNEIYDSQRTILSAEAFDQLVEDLEKPMNPTLAAFIAKRSIWDE